MRAITTRFDVKSAMFAVVAAMLLLTACEGGGRVDTYGTTDAERSDPRIQTTALLEFSDQFTQRLVQQLATIPEIANSPKPVTVIIGDISNKTGNVSSNDFELVQQRIRANLVNSGFISKQMIFVENRARMNALAAREGIGAPGASGPPAYDPQTTFTLNGDVYRIDRGNTNFYWMGYSLVNFSSNRMVFEDQFPSKQAMPD
jgi:hypothetical protein